MCIRDRLQGGLGDVEHGKTLLSQASAPGGSRGAGFGLISVLSGGDGGDLSQAFKDGGVDGQGGGGLGVDGDQAARHLVIVLQAVHAPGHGLVGQIGRFGTQVGVVEDVYKRQVILYPRLFVSV